MTRRVCFSLNGGDVCCEVNSDRLLLDVLREDFALNGPKYGCGKAQCGACIALVDGKPARLCVLRAIRAEGRKVVTLEGLADPVSGALSRVQQGFLEEEGAQCGYCLNGMVMQATALLARNPNPDRAQIRDALRHNLCRCGTHAEILASVERAVVLGLETGGKPNE